MMCLSRTCRECRKEFRAFKNYVVCLACRTADGINTSAHCQKEWAKAKEKVMHYDQGAREQLADLFKRVVILEQQVAKQALHNRKVDTLADMNIQLQSQAAQQQATEQLYAPLRSDTKPLIDLAAFARRLLNPDDLGHAVTHEVRNAARRALGLPEVREYDL